MLSVSTADGHYTSVRKIPGHPLVLHFDEIPPSANHAFTVNKYIHRIVPTTEAKKYMAKVQESATLQADGWVWHGSWLVLYFQLYLPDNRRHDLSNCKKLLEDGIKKGIGVDDKWYLWRDLVPIVDRTQSGGCDVFLYQDESQGVLEIA